MKKCIIIKKMTLIYSVPSIVPRKCSEIRWNSIIRFLGLYNVQVMSSPFCRFKNFTKKRKYYQRNLQMINPYWNFFQYPVMTGMLQNDVGFSVFIWRSWHLGSSPSKFNQATFHDVTILVTKNVESWSLQTETESLTAKKDTSSDDTKIWIWVQEYQKSSKSPPYNIFKIQIFSFF